MNPPPFDPKEYLGALDEQWNARNLDGALSFFSGNAVMRFVPPLPGGPAVYLGKEEIREALKTMLPAFLLRSSGHRQTGYTFAWQAEVSSDALRQLGIDLITGSGEAAVHKGKLKAFTITFALEALANLSTALGTAPDKRDA